MSKSLSLSLRRTLMLVSFSILIAFAMQFSQVSASTNEVKADTPPLELKLTAFASGVCLNSSFDIEAELVNVSHADIMVNKYFLSQALNRASATRVYPDDCEGEIFIEMYCGGWDENDLVTLAPGQSYRAIRTFEARTLFSCQGSYDITSEYQSRATADWGANLYRGRVTSNKLRVEATNCG